jgi:hypothetical protein
MMSGNNVKFSVFSSEFRVYAVFSPKDRLKAELPTEN